MITVVNKEDIMSMTGYSESQSRTLIRLTKSKLVSDGFDWYRNKRVGRVPIQTIEVILGFELNPKNDIIDIGLHDTGIVKGEPRHDSN